MSLLNIFCGIHRLVRIRCKSKISDAQNNVNLPPFFPNADGHTHVTEEAPAGDIYTKETHDQDVHTEEASTETNSLDLPETFSDAMDEFRELVEGMNNNDNENNEEPRNPQFSSRYGSAIIAILVGPDETPFNVHQSFLEESEFFKACFKRGFREENEKLVRLPEGDPSDFIYLVDFLYTGSIPYHSYAANPISDMDVFTDENLWWADAWCPDPTYLHCWYPTPEHLSPIFRCTMFETDWEEEEWETSHEKKCVDEAKEHLDLLLRLYQLSDQYLFDGFREHILEHILHAANYCEPYHYFDALCMLYDHPTGLPESFRKGVRKYIEFYIKGTNREIAMEFGLALADNTRLTADIMQVMYFLIDELCYFRDLRSRAVRPRHLSPQSTMQ
ncbi:hypothetical protein Plec18167_005235 [Paecilomyces lecythidis]|uniref:BTB domain-containing protein n=1 Tax=Paecilomyces lecythidis TaxID=3004212 RepID=A0ABR3XK35_9EURO